MMPSLLDVGWRVFCLFLFWDKLTDSSSAHGVEVQCSRADPLETQHPVQVLMERFQVGRGCAAREQGNKETHVIALERVRSSGNKVMVLLRPLSPSPPRTLHLVLSSKLPVSWVLESEQLPPNVPVSVQVSPNSSVQSHALRLRVQTVRSLPSRLHALHRWALKHHGSLTSLMHARHGNQVYIGLGEDPTLPAVCQLQSLFFCPKTTQISDLQPQEVKGCVHPVEGDASPEVHVIRLRSAGSGFCGSLQVEVIVSLVPPVATLKQHKVVLILSSSSLVSWVITAPGVQGHISVYSSSSVSPPSPPESNLTLSSTLDAELATVSELLVWANQSGYTQVTSYTEADLANRFVIQLAESSTALHTLPHTSHRGLRLLEPVLDGKTAQKSLTVNCDGGLLSVTVDQQTLQGSSVAAVTLQDQRCQALSNGSHFLLALPVIFCGTEAVMVDEPRGVLYKNRVLLWRNESQTIDAVGVNDDKHPLNIHISCFAASPSDSAADDETLPLIGRFTRGVKHGPQSVPGLSYLPLPRLRPGPVLHLKLFVTESYEQTWIGPCVITADHRVFVEISAKAPLSEVVQVKECFVSPLSDPRKSPFWVVISNSCSSDSSFALSAKTKSKTKDESESDVENIEEGVMDKLERVRNDHKGIRSSKMDNSTLKDTHSLKFSFILRPTFNDSMQFLHCSLLLCLSDSTRGEPMKEAVKNECQTGIPIPPLVSISPRQESQCEIRNLSRPMVVTRPISSLVHKVLPSADQRTKSLSITSVISPDKENSSLGVQTGPLMGLVFAAFMIGVSLMGGLWCIYKFTGGRPENSTEGFLTEQTDGGHRDQPFLSDQSSSSV